MQIVNYPDIGFTAEYQDLWADTAFGGEPCHFNHAGIDYRFYKRPIPNTDWFDITSPYGYSGPVIVEEGANYYEFATKLHDYAQENRIVSEFARLHPWQSAVFVNRTYSNEVAYIDLTQTEDEIWHGFDKGCRSTIKKQQKEATVYINTYAAINDAWVFSNLYNYTMSRKGANSQYTFGHSFYERLDTLHPLILEYYSHNEELKNLSWAKALFFFYGDYATYFLSGGQGGSNLILWTAIKEAKARGCKIFNLGGGLHDGDSLSSYKRSFTKTAKPFYTYRKIHNQAVYDQICKEKGIDPNSDGFFPAYRR